MKALRCPVTRVYPQAENARGCREAYSTCDQPSSRALFLSPTAPTTCPSLEAPAHGTKFGSKYFVGHEVHFTCSQGYHLVGSATRVCRDNGTWTGIGAICKGEPHWETVELDTEIPINLPQILIFWSCVRPVFDSGEECSLTTVCFHHRIRSFFSPYKHTSTTTYVWFGGIFWARTSMSVHYSLLSKKPNTHLEQPWLSSVWMPGRKRQQPRGQTELLTHTQITGKEKSHSLEWLELLSILNEALVKMALNVSEHRKTPVLHSTVECLTLQVSTPHEQQRLGYCKINPPLSCSCFSGSLTAVPLDGVRSRHYTHTMVW